MPAANRLSSIAFTLNRPIIHRLLIVLSFAAVALGNEAFAEDCLTPSPDVVNSVTLRAAPTTSSAALGQFKVHTFLPFIASLPRWYEARQADGTSVFIAKRWTVIAPCPAGVTATTVPLVPAPGGSGDFELHAIDVGTGLSILVRGADFALLYDAGSNDDLARGDKNRTLAYIRTLEPTVVTLDHVILSHPHRDHVELLADVVKQFKPHDVWNSGAYNDICGYRNFLFAIAAEASVQYHTATYAAGNEAVELDAQSCYGEAQSKQTLTLKHGSRIDHEAIALGQNASMTFLNVDGSHHADFNENSLVMRLDLGSHRVLLMGDAEAGGRKAPSSTPAANSIEGKLLACCAADVKADVLIVGHHGSKTSSRKAFLSAVAAKWFVISAGPTKYGSVVLPDQEVVDEIEGLGTLFRTDLNDEACADSAAKVGPDTDGKAGGCDNILIKIPRTGAISAAYRRLAD